MSESGLTVDDFARYRAELINQFQGGPTVFSPIPFAAFTEELLALYEPPLRAKASQRGMRQVLRLFGELIGPAGTTADITPGLIARFIASRPATESPNTTIGHLNRFRAACSYAAAQGYCRVSPFTIRKRWIRPSAPRVEKKRHHSAEEIARVLKLLRDDTRKKVPGSWAQWRARRLYALVSLLAYTGLRKTEALRLRVEDIDIPSRIILVVSRSGNRLKTAASAQPVPMPDALAGILAEWLPHLQISEELMAMEHAGPLPAANPLGEKDAGWLFPNVFRTGPWVGGSPGNRPHDRIKAAGQRAGVEEFTAKSLRHSWATHAESRWGLSEAMIQRVLRHTTTKTQKHYRHADPANLKAAVRGVSFGGEPPAPADAPPADPPALLLLPPETVDAGDKVPDPRACGPKLDDADVLELKELRARGWTYGALCQRYGVSKSTLHSALYGLTHRHIPDFNASPEER